jgi:hypothetical protein
MVCLGPRVDIVMIIINNSVSRVDHVTVSLALVGPLGCLTKAKAFMNGASRTDRVGLQEDGGAPVEEAVAQAWRKRG